MNNKTGDNTVALSIIGKGNEVEKILNVPTNIISGFLGVGKTTAILHLFANKPATEKWAVLVNEFGNIGIDGKLYETNGIAVKEIPGGCMCCAQGLPLQVAVNRLLRETRPDRLIIESSGIGHPAGVLSTLSGEGFDETLQLKASICLIDPENLIQPEYRNNELFKEQIQLADILVANKIDLASIQALQVFQQLGESLQADKQLITETRNAQLSVDWLQYKHVLQAQPFTFRKLSEEPEKKWQTHSFNYPQETLFNLNSLKHWLENIDVLRLKGLVKTANGPYLLNLSSGHIDITKLDHPAERSNYIEIIDSNLDDSNLDIAQLEKGLNGCIEMA